MLHTIKSQLKTYTKQILSTYHQSRSLRYFLTKTTQYLALHTNLKPLPQEHKEAVLAYWSKFINGGGGKYKEAKSHS